MKTFTTTEQVRLLLNKWENLWILKLKTLYPDGLKQELTTLEAYSLSSSVQSLTYVPLSSAVGT